MLAQGTYVKDLSILGRPIERTLIVDNTPQAYGFHVDNAVPITSWYDDPADRELTDLLALMDEVAAAPDVRPVLARWFRLTERVHLAAERAFNAALEARARGGGRRRPAPPAPSLPVPPVLVVL